MANALNVVVGITGGIAAFKAVNIVRQLVLAGHDVHVIATANALRFIGKPTLEAISRNPVLDDLFEGVSEVRHVAVGQAADLVIVAPATADAIARYAAGLAGDLLGSTLLTTKAPVLLAPAMHTEMWHHPATAANIAVLRSRGVNIVGPTVGRLTGDDEGEGRMSEPTDVVAAALGLLTEQDLSGVRVLVSAGGTREAIDPVRFIGNRSSGRQGFAIAEAAKARGATVTLVVAHPESGPAGIGIETVSVSSAEQMRQEMLSRAPWADLVIMAAAVADYRPAEVSQAKLKKESVGEELVIRLVRNPDILGELLAARKVNQVIVGFAAETETDSDRLMELARAKVYRKPVDLLVVNRVGWNEVFGAEDNSVSILGKDGGVLGAVSGSKSEVAGTVLDIANQLNRKS